MRQDLNESGVACAIRPVENLRRAIARFSGAAVALYLSPLRKILTKLMRDLPKTTFAFARGSVSESRGKTAVFADLSGH